MFLAGARFSTFQLSAKHPDKTKRWQHVELKNGFFHLELTRMILRLLSRTNCFPETLISLVTESSYSDREYMYTQLLQLFISLVK